MISSRYAVRRRVEQGSPLTVAPTSGPPPQIPASGTFTFSDAAAGHVVDLGSAPTVGQIDVLCINSNSTVTTPSGFTLTGASRVGNQQGTVYYRIAAGGEGSTVTVTTGISTPTQVSWLRLAATFTGIDVGAVTGADGVAGTSSVAVSSGVLGFTGEIVIMCAALHDFAAAPAVPVWSAGYTNLLTDSLSTGATAVAAFTAYKLNAGTAAESPSVSWTGSASDRYSLLVTFH